MVTGLREMCALFGLDTVKPYRDVVEKKKEESTDTVIQDAASTLLDVIDGRSLAKVAQDLDEKQEDIDKLNVAVAGTKVVVKKVQRTVNEHDKEIKETKAGLIDVNQRVDVVEEDLEETKGKVEEIDMKTMTNAPKWSRDVTKLMNPESDHDWRLLSSRLGYSADDIRGWATQSDPCMAMLSEWYATHKTVEATHGVLVALQEMNREDAAVIVENAMKAVEGIVADEPVDYPEPPEIFLSYQWGHQNEVKLIQRHLERAGYKCWMDIGQMGGGDKLFEKIDTGIRAAKIIICCVTEKYAKSPNCNREVNLSVNLGKPIIPLLVEKMSWPPKGSMGPIFSEYLFIRFFQRPGEETKDDRIWPVAKFQELLMQLNCFKVMPDETAVTDEYKNWWIPVLENIVIEKKNTKTVGENKVTTTHTETDSGSPDVFISYQWGKQKEISVLYQRLTGLGYTCWMDIHQMGGGDSLYDKIDRGIRGCKVVLTSITQKYALSANCRREVSLADALKKPIIPLLMEKSDWPPSGPMSMVFTQLLFINFCKDESVQLRWDGPKFEELQQKLHQHVPLDNDEGLKQEEPPVTMATVANGSSDKKEMKNDEKSQDNARIHNQQSSTETKDVPLSSQGNDSASGKPVINNDPASSSNSTNTTAGNKVSSDTTMGPDQRKDTAKTNDKEQKSAKKSSTCSIL
ncbi:hypothetical protein FSP39_006291 [Pinctada imbricata]|uniref:Death domain-containing protein n=1 Tax=Pinctada imbricata TaxID=66713 RepID=A0AA89BWL9_PINIB|nr:hypothetical protein FSP39_006291 [Pinctada imbricata]